jgi:hypothetical protein
MLLDEWVSMTRRVVLRDGFDDFLPVACFPGRHEVRVLEGLPAESEPEAAVLKWAEGLAMQGEEFLVAFKLDPRHFKVLRWSEGSEETAICEISDN